MALAETPISPPEVKFVYSDINFLVLGALVERVSGVPLEVYCQQKNFAPLGMANTRFLPPAAWLPKIAPTQYDERGQMLHAIVHDPTVRRMAGVGGQAGLFSTADDLSKFAQALLDKSTILSPLTVEKMTTPQQPPNAPTLRGFGWDIDSPFSSNRGELLQSDPSATPALPAHRYGLIRRHAPISFCSPMPSTPAERGWPFLCAPK